MVCRSLVCCCSVALLLVAAGCGQAVRSPRWNDPGNAASQRYDAIVHDPYPSEDVGPEVVGGRPRGFQAPVPQVRDGRLFTPEPTVVAPPPPAFPAR